MVGKRVVDDLYIHLDWIGELADSEWRDAIGSALVQIDGDPLGRPVDADRKLSHF